MSEYSQIEIKGGFVMRRKIIILITAMLLVIGMTAVTAFAGTMSGSYSTSTRQKVGTAYNSSGEYKTAYGHLYPGATSPAAVLQICNANGTLVKASGTYSASTSSSDTTCPIAPGETLSFYVRPVVNDQYVWGTEHHGIY